MKSLQRTAFQREQPMGTRGRELPHIEKQHQSRRKFEKVMAHLVPFPTRPREKDRKKGIIQWPNVLGGIMASSLGNLPSSSASGTTFPANELEKKSVTLEKIQNWNCKCKANNDPVQPRLWESKRLWLVKTADRRP